MIDLLRQLGIPAVSIIVIAALSVILKELWTTEKARRRSLADGILSRQLLDIENRLSHFYLPLSQMLALAKHIFNFTSHWRKEEKYDNNALKIESENPNALRDIVVKRIFLPLNENIEAVIIKYGYLKLPEDNSNYEKILQHLYLWGALEKAKNDGEIKDYNAKKYLHFPAEEVPKIITTCNNLVEKKNKVFEMISELRSPRKLMFDRERKGG